MIVLLILMHAESLGSAHAGLRLSWINGCEGRRNLQGVVVNIQPSVKIMRHVMYGRSALGGKLYFYAYEISLRKLVIIQIQ